MLNFVKSVTGQKVAIYQFSLTIIFFTELAPISCPLASDAEPEERHNEEKWDANIWRFSL